MELNNTAKVIKSYIDDGMLGNVAIRVGRNGDVLAELYKSKDGQVDCNTLFDMASVTKILSVTVLSLIAMDKGLIRMEDRVSQFFDYSGNLTLKNLLTHTMGIGHKNLCKNGVTYDNIGEYILSIPPDIPVGSDVLYSCPAFILMGKILEKVFGKRLDVLFREMVAEPLGMKNSGFLPDTRGKAVVNSNIKNDEAGKVNDYNCRFLGGVAGNAGIFSCIDDLTRFADMLIAGGAPLISQKTYALATENHTLGMSESRGLGFLYVDGRYGQTGRLFGDGAIGHCGHTGQSLFADRKSGLYAIILSDATISTVKKYGNEDYGQVIAMRQEIHNVVKQDLSL